MQNVYNRILTLLITIVVFYTADVSIAMAQDDVGQPTRPIITPIRPPTRTIPRPPTSAPPPPQKPKPTQPSTPDAPVSPPPASTQPEAPPSKTDSPVISPTIHLPALPEKTDTTQPLIDEMYVPDEVLVVMPYTQEFTIADSNMDRQMQTAANLELGIEKLDTKLQIAKLNYIQSMTEEQDRHEEKMTEENRLEIIGREADIPLLEIATFKTVGLVTGRYRIPEGRRLFETMDEITLLLEGMAGERVFVQPNYYFEAQGVDEPLNYNMQAIRAYESHRIATGKGVTIALLDTPVDTEHLAYRGRVQEERGIIEKEPPGAHGTALAGVIAGKRYGVAPDVKLISIPVCKTEKNRAPRTTSFLLARGLDLALQREVKVINLSLGGPRDSFVGLLVDEALKRKTVIVAAAGNSGPKGAPPYPASHTGVIAVTAIDHRDRIDPRATRGPHVSLSAPGVDIITSAPGERQQVSTGTSVAAAHVTGIVALIFEQWRDATPQFVKTLLESSAHDLGPSGKDPEYGAGRVDALRALERLIVEKKKTR